MRTTTPSVVYLAIIACLCYTSLANVCDPSFSCSSYDDCKTQNANERYRCVNDKCVPPECDSCVETQICIQGSCIDKITVSTGAQCNETHICDSKDKCHCVTQGSSDCSCVGPILVGQSCKEVDNCAFGLDCNQADICSETIIQANVGDECTSQAMEDTVETVRNCNPVALFCNQNTLKCEYKKVCIGDTCTSDIECFNGNCIGGKCARFNLQIGEDCTDNEECQSNNCTASQCAGMDCSQLSCGTQECFVTDTVPKFVCGDPELSCDFNTEFWNDKTFKCETKRANLHECEGDEDCQSDNCPFQFRGSVCLSKTPSSLGEACTTDQAYNSNCQKELRCISNNATEGSIGTCQTPLSVNDTCFRDSDCGNGAECEARICAQQFGYKDPCNATYILDNSEDTCGFGFECFCDGSSGSGTCQSETFETGSNVAEASSSIGLLSTIVGVKCYSIFDAYSKTNCATLINNALFGSFLANPMLLGNTFPEECRNALAEMSCCVICTYDGPLNINIVSGGTLAGQDVSDISKLYAVLAIAGLPGGRPDMSLDCSLNGGKGGITFPEICPTASVPGQKNIWSSNIAQVRTIAKCNDFVTPAPVASPTPVSNQPVEPISGSPSSSASSMSFVFTLLCLVSLICM